MRWCVLVIAACGRIAFDPLADATAPQACAPTTPAATFGVSREFASGPAAYWAAVGDVDGDGFPDAVTDVTGDGVLDVLTSDDGANTISLLAGNGDGTLQPAVAFPVGAGPYGVVVADLNRDGRLDVVAPDETSGQLSVLLATCTR